MGEAGKGGGEREEGKGGLEREQRESHRSSWEVLLPKSPSSNFQAQIHKPQAKLLPVP